MTSGNTSTMELGAAAPPDNTMPPQDSQRTQSMLEVDTFRQAPQSDGTLSHHIDETSHLTSQINAKPSSDPSIYLPGAKTMFMDLPPEARVMVYELALHREFVIEITSLKKWNPKKKRTKISNNSPAITLLLVNKQIHDEAVPVFYKINDFLIGNGDWVTRHQANLHGLQSFISRVQPRHLSLITLLWAFTHFRTTGLSDWQRSLVSITKRIPVLGSGSDEVFSRRYTLGDPSSLGSQAEWQQFCSFCC